MTVSAPVAVVSSPHDVVRAYAAQGIRLVFWPSNGDAKGPREPGWPSKTYAPEDYRESYRVGILTGTEIAPGHFLTDVDIDWADGSYIAQQLLPPTGFVFGRASKRVSHCFYTTPEPLPSARFEDIDKTCLIELRGTKANGDIGFQTMAPPSVWSKDGKREPLSFVKAERPYHVEANVLRTSVRDAATAMLLAKHLGANGFGHEPRLAWAGYMLRAGVPLDRLAVMGEAISLYCRNREVDDVRRTLESTAAALAKDAKKVTGGPALARLLGTNGKAVVARINEWLGRTDALVLNPNDPMTSARVFVERSYMLDDVRTLHHQAGLFTEYRAEHAAYHERDEAAVRSDLYKFLEPVMRHADSKASALAPFQPTRGKVENVLDALRAVTNLPTSQAPPCWLSEAPAGLNPVDIVSCPNGLLHVPTRELLAPTPRFFTLNGIDFAYDPHAPQPASWLAFLETLWPDDAEAISTLQEIFGYALVPDTRFQKIFLIVGPPRSGKGVTARVLRRLVGERNTCAPTLAAFGASFGKQVLVNKTLAIIADARISGRTDTASVAETLLSISGEDSQTIARKFLPDWNGKLPTRFLLLTNELPDIGDASGALTKRFIVLTLKESFYGRENPALFELLLPELPGILNWALEGRDRLYARGYFVQPASANDLIEQFANLSSPEAAFLREYTQTEPGCVVSQKELFDAWRVWCESNGRDKPGSAATFARNVRATLPWVTTRRLGARGEQERCWEGLRLVLGDQRSGSTEM